MPRKSCASTAATSMTQQSNEWVCTSMLMSFAARRKNCLKFTSGDSRSSSLLMTALKHKLHGKSKERSNCGLQSSLVCLPALAVVPAHLHSMEISPRRGKTVHPAARRAAQEAAAHCRPTHLPCATYCASP